MFLCQTLENHNKQAHDGDNKQVHSNGYMRRPCKEYKMGCLAPPHEAQKPEVTSDMKFTDRRNWFRLMMPEKTHGRNHVPQT